MVGWCLGDCSVIVVCADVRCARVFRSLAIAVVLVGLVGVVLSDLWVLRL